MTTLSLAQALTWRLQRHSLLPPDATSVADVAQRVVAFRAWPAHLANQMVSVRLAESVPDSLEDALARGDVVSSYALRGGAYVFTHEAAAAMLRVRTTTRVWEQRRYQQQGHFAINDWEPLRAAVRDALSDGPKTRDELRAHITGIPALRHLDVGATGAGSDSLYKPLHWWGDICFGPPRDGQSTFRLLHGDPRWVAHDDLDAAGRLALTHYLAAYAPATIDNLIYWFTEGLSVPRRQLLQWLHDLCDVHGVVSEIVIAGRENYLLTTDLGALHAAKPTDALRLLPGYDPWLLGPGTADARLLAPTRRDLATRGANLVIRGGIVCGTWRLQQHLVTVNWFTEAGPTPVPDLSAEMQRLAAQRGEDLALNVVPL